MTFPALDATVEYPLSTTEGDTTMPLADDELTISQAAKEFHIERRTLNNYVTSGKLPARQEMTELGTFYWIIKRSELSNLLDKLPKIGRPRKRTP